MDTPGNAPRTIDLTVTDVAHGGVFVARHEGRVVFVSDAIPGETVRARLTDQRKKSFWRAETVDVLDASPHRRDHVWAAADVSVVPEHRPGGAEFGHIDVAHQRELKGRVLSDALGRFGGLEDTAVAVEKIDGEKDGTGYRTRLSLHVDDAGRIGPFAARSHRVIEVDSHPLATAAVERAAFRLTPGRGDRIDLVQASDGHVRVVNRASDERERAHHEVIVETVNGRDFRVDADGFWQVHHAAATTLDAAVADMLGTVDVDPEAWHLDLYGGVGLFAATLATAGATRVTSVEADARATEHAGENLAEWIGARAETARVDRYTRRLLTDASGRERERIENGIVVLDPPRAGAGRQVVEDLAALAPRALVYVACDPVALARDLGTFAQHGYRPSALRAFDLFPNSHHMETVALLQR